MEIITYQEAKDRDLRFYFTGLPCKRGHIDVIYVSSRVCRQCKKDHQKLYRSGRLRMVTGGQRTGRRHPDDKHARRRCLGCKKTFDSEGFHVRLCVTCRSKPDIGYDHESSLPTW